MPGLPSACYASQAHLLEQVNSALDGITNEIERGETANRAIREQQDSLKQADPFAEAARIQRLMAAEPERAMQALQQVNGLSQQAVDGESLRLAEEWQGLTIELDRWVVGFEDTLSNSRAPLTARFDALAADQGVHEPCGEMYCLNQRGVELHNRIVEDWNSSHDRLCLEQGRSQTGLIGRLERFRQFLAIERLPFDVKAEAAAQATAALVGQGATMEFLEIAPWQAARDSLQAVQRAFQLRQGQPLRTEEYWMKK